MIWVKYRLYVHRMAENKTQHQSTYKGWLYKWTNYLKGYQKRWFVLQNGLLSYYRYVCGRGNISIFVGKFMVTYGEAVICFRIFLPILHFHSNCRFRNGFEDDIAIAWVNGITNFINGDDTKRTTTKMNKKINLSPQLSSKNFKRSWSL